jgi:type IV secretion system protein VirB2
MSDHERNIRLKTVLARTGLSRSTMYRKIAEGSFPCQLKISVHGAGWRESAVNRWFADPQGAGVVVNAMRWMQDTLLGTVATVAAVIAIASVGFLMLTGRINWRHGGVVILGCFILFGAASIVAGIQSAATLSGVG